ncbi:MAG TPA: methylmalonyl-CoA mutase family protein [Dehalococcoidia bacterium]|nr:methylmalonyl-CoA mutase family protein [Dehalococcoidia bacterium]
MVGEKERSEVAAQPPLVPAEQATERSFVTTSGRPVRPVYTEADLGENGAIAAPGEYPYTRGIHASGYRGKTWTIRNFAGFGDAEETNKRFRYLLEHGQDGLSVAFDLPTLMGVDADDATAAGEFGHCGVGVSSLADMEILFREIPLGEISTSMTINSPASAIWAMYIAAAEKQGFDRAQLRGTLQNDILKEYTAQNEYIYPPEPAMRLVVDTIEFGAQQMPQWNTISISGYHIREAGSTAAQELAFTLADGFAYVEAALERGLEVDDFAPRLSFFFNCHNDLFEEVAKFRAARRIWARHMRESYGAVNPRSWWLRFHTQTAGCSLTSQQPDVNLIRTTVQALAATMGGTQSLHTNALDEALALPSERAARLALRTQQVLLHESGVVNTVDPLGGSYFIEALTDEMERDAEDYFARINDFGGVIPALKAGFFQKEIADASYRYQHEVQEGSRVIVGVNEYEMDEEEPIEILRVDPESYRRHMDRLNRTRSNRDQGRATAAISALETACQQDENTMPALIECANAYVTLGEMTAVMRGVFGVHRENLVI